MKKSPIVSPDTSSVDTFFSGLSIFLHEYISNYLQQHHTLPTVDSFKQQCLKYINMSDTDIFNIKLCHARYTRGDKQTLRCMRPVDDNSPFCISHKNYKPTSEFESLSELLDNIPKLKILNELPVLLSQLRDVTLKLTTHSDNLDST